MIIEFKKNFAIRKICYPTVHPHYLKRDLPSLIIEKSVEGRFSYYIYSRFYNNIIIPNALRSAIRLSLLNVFGRI